MGKIAQWRLWSRPLLILIHTCLAIIALPLMVFEFQQHQTDLMVQSWFVGGLFVMLTLPISFWSILHHLIHYTQPHLQRHIIRIIWMVPIYSINAWFGMRFERAAIYLDSARECYEAYVIYNFMSYLVNYLHSKFPDLEQHLSFKPQIRFPPPLCYARSWTMGRELMERCKHGVMQYTIIRPLTTIIGYFTFMAGGTTYGEGVFNFHSVWTYLIVINNFSQIFAMFCLITFYLATKEELKPIKPIAKFMCVKAVVFLSFWQGLLIVILVNVRVIPHKKYGTILQDFCICIEMLIAAAAHNYSFSYRPYIDPLAHHVGWIEAFKSMWDISDVQKDVVEHFRQVGDRASDMLAAPLKNFGGGEERRGSRGEGGEWDESEDETNPLLSPSLSKEELSH